jgi:hypothetical protein
MSPAIVDLRQQGKNEKRKLDVLGENKNLNLIS